MVTKITTISLLSLIFFYFLIPADWLFIYEKSFFGFSSHRNLSQFQNPIKVINENFIENTYQALRPGGRKHEGIDIFAPVGTNIYSVIDGNILDIGRDILGGNTIKIFGSDNRIYYFAHLDSLIPFESMDRVKRDELIGFVGATGNAVNTPPHLHFEVMEISWYFPLILRNINPYDMLK